MNEPRPAMISARPPEIRSSVAKFWKTRTGSSELSTVTALVRRMFFVRSAAAASTTAGAEDSVVGAVGLADAEDLEAELIREFDLLEEVAKPLCRVGLGAEVGEGVEAKFHQRLLSGRVRCTRTPGNRTEFRGECRE